MSFSINTNVASLQAQNYLRINSDFQSKTINRVTSGLRIVSSGDDAAGLAIANGYRSDTAVLTQGVQNANDGLSQLQIIDGGMSNISQLLDRARTLATQSASGTFTGDRSVLNGEFSSVLGEIDRQAQSIGLDTGGTFAKNLSVFIGGGKVNNGTSAIQNGSVSVNLASSTVDTKGLGLKGSPAINGTAYNLGNNSSTSVANVVSANGGPGGQSVFYFEGPGFGDTNKVKVTVSNAGLTDTNSLLTAINTQIGVTANGGTTADTAFKNAGVQAVVTTDSNGNQMLGFTSSNTAFQVEAGNATANAFLGNFDATTPALGASLTTKVTGAGNATDANENGETFSLQFSGAGLTSPVTLTGISGTGSTAADITTAITTENGLSTAFARAGFTVAETGGKLVFSSSSGEKFNVAVAGDQKNALGMGNAVADAGGNVTYSTVQGTNVLATVAADTLALNISVGGRASTVLTITSPGGGTAATAAGATTLAGLLNNQIQTLGAGNDIFDAGIHVTTNGAALVFTSTNGSKFQIGSNSTQTAADNIGFGTGTLGLASLPANTIAPVVASPVLDSGSVNQSAQFNFGGIAFGGDTQNVTVAATDSTGTLQTKSIGLTAANAGSIDQAINTLNVALQSTNNPILQSVVAVKTVSAAGAEAIMLQSGTTPFTTTLGTTAHTGEGLNMPTGTAQGIANNSTLAAGGNTLDISTQTGAQAAVNTIATAVGTLGSAQAVVGRGENEFNYAVNLAQSELTNLTTADSRIRDADLAAEAANLTKAQILVQAGVAALAQANAAPQQILALLKG